MALPNSSAESSISNTGKLSPINTKAPCLILFDNQKDSLAFVSKLVRLITNGARFFSFILQAKVDFLTNGTLSTPFPNPSAFGSFFASRLLIKKTSQISPPIVVPGKEERKKILVSFVRHCICSQEQEM